VAAQEEAARAEVAAELAAREEATHAAARAEELAKEAAAAEAATQEDMARDRRRWDDNMAAARRTHEVHDLAT
jgi:hypothetical protein